MPPPSDCQSVIRFCKISQLQCQQLLLCTPQAALRRQHGQVITNTRLIATQANIDRLLLSFNILALCIQLLFKRGPPRQCVSDIFKCALNGFS